jgi:hypothetical protein
MKTPLVILLCVELAAAVALGQFGSLHRRELDRAWLERREHPTMETRAIFERQKRITELERWGLSGVVFAVLAGATVLVYWIRKGEPGASPNGGPATPVGNAGVTEGPPSVS